MKTFSWTGFLMNMFRWTRFLMNSFWWKCSLMNSFRWTCSSMNSFLFIDEQFSMNLFIDEQFSVSRRPTQIIYCRACQAALRAGQPIFFQMKISVVQRVLKYINVYMYMMIWKVSVSVSVLTQTNQFCTSSDCFELCRPDKTHYPSNSPKSSD